jgi:hypothetical protein
VTLGLVDGEGGLKFDVHPVKPGIQLNPGEGITGRAVSTGTIINVPDVTKEDTYVRVSAETKSELAVPLKWNEAVIGVLDIQSSDFGAFTSQHEDLLSVFADQAAIAIQNAKQINRLTTLHAIGQKINSILDLKELVRELYEQTRKVIHSDVFTLALYKEKFETVDVYAASKDQQIEVGLSTENLTGWVIKNKIPVFVKDASQESPPKELAILAIDAGRKSLSSAIIHPLL